MAIGILFSPVKAWRSRKGLLSTALFMGLLVAPQFCMAQATPASGQNRLAEHDRASKPASESTPLTDRERAELLQLIRALQDRVAKLESEVSEAKSSTAPDAKPQAPAAALGAPAKEAVAATAKAIEPAPPDAVAAAKAPEQADERKEFGTYTPNLGFKLADTEKGDLNVSIYTYGRYLNQQAIDATYKDAFGNIKNVQQRQDFQLQKVQIKFLGWLFTPKFRYFLYTWTSNATQGQGAQVVVAGNLNYSFNENLTLSVGITSLPGARSTEGNFPFWLGVDSRLIADEFFRPSYTSGIWVKGKITDTLTYQAMVGNNLSTLGVSAAQLDKKFNTFASSLIWTPTTGEFGQGLGDFEGHKEMATRLAAHFTRSDESRQSQPDNDTFENTQLRLSDGNVIFTPNLFGPDITITDAAYKMTSVDAGIKYRGFALEGEYYWRWLNNFQGNGTAGLTSLFDHGFQLQGSAMVMPNLLQLYIGGSRIAGQFGNPWDFRSGANWFPWKNKVLRWNTEWLYLHKSPVGATSLPYAVGGRGNVFHSTLELAF